ncbi:hypothetical protein IAR55_004552 [Kwoniella newhampshirensis]|uniref:Uncharacterized protein n=1 Tax=Kwoniella newhampshirensis TaxID=1651941 RepID=A0AAW0YNR6_9TREE
MEAATQPPSKKPGFFRKSSLSNQAQPVTPVVHSHGHSPGNHSKIGSRSSSGAFNKKDVVAGPSYESLPSGAAPSVFRNRNDRAAEEDGAKPGTERIGMKREGRGALARNSIA